MRERVLVVLQWFFGLYFIGVGVMHFIVPDGLPSMMAWMYELNDTLHLISGTAEILGGLGLILPMVTGIRPELATFAAAGLALLMVGAIVWHAGRGEYTQIANNVVLGGLVGYLAYARWRISPLEPRTAEPAGNANA